MMAKILWWLFLGGVVVGSVLIGMWLNQPIEPIDVLGDGIVKYRAADRTQTQMEALNSGLRLWSDANPDIAFERSADDFEVDISFVYRTRETNSLGTPAVGVFTCSGSEGEYFSSCVRDFKIEISGGHYNCDGNEWNVNYMANIVAHEIGHLLGLEHHADEDHLLHGADRVQVPFDDGGLIIPDELPYSDSCEQ